MNYRSMRIFWYALYDSTHEQTDEYGNICGTYPTYQNPVRAVGNISPANGTVVMQPFGADEHYDRVITVPDSSTPIDEHAVLWIDTVPDLDANGALTVNADGEIVTPWDYIVRRVARGLELPGSAHIAVGKVDVR